MSGRSSHLAWRVVATGAAVGGAAVTKKAMGTAWRAATGNEPPANPENPDTTWPEALVWALITGAAVGVVRLLVTRRAASSWRGLTGALPPGLEPVDAY